MTFHSTHLEKFPSCINPTLQLLCFLICHLFLYPLWSRFWCHYSLTFILVTSPKFSLLPNQVDHFYHLTFPSFPSHGRMFFIYLPCLSFSDAFWGCSFSAISLVVNVLSGLGSALFASLSLCYFFLSFFLLGPCLWHMEDPRLGVQSKL